MGKKLTKPSVKVVEFWWEPLIPVFVFVFLLLYVWWTGGFSGSEHHPVGKDYQESKIQRELDRLEMRDRQLYNFQETHGVSNKIAEAAIKEWVFAHQGNLDWDLEEVKVICLRKLKVAKEILK